MTIANIINDYGKKHSPYMGGFINHLPMGQLALYNMTKDLESVQIYSKKFIEMYSIDKVDSQFPKIESLCEALGKADLYESALEAISAQVESDGVEISVKHILNSYDLGMSSGLFHVLIRLAYSIEGYALDSSLADEVSRALAYYITAYREASVFSRKVQSENITKAMETLWKSSAVQTLISGKSGLGQKMKSLYKDIEYVNSGFILEGDTEDKVESLLKLSINAYLNSGSIVALHCITGLHALTVLKPYFKDFSRAVDILTTCIITHMISGDIEDFTVNKDPETPLLWSDILKKASKSLDVHAIKLTYSSHELYNLYGIEKLKDVALKRIL